MVGPIYGVGSVGPQMGFIRQGTIRDYDVQTGKALVSFTLAKNQGISEDKIMMSLPASWAGPNGEFSGGFPPRGATVECSYGLGGQWAIINYVPPPDLFGDRNTVGRRGYGRNTMSALRSGCWLTQVRNNIRILCDPNAGIQLGNPEKFIQADPVRGIFSNTFSNNMAFTEANREVIGLVKRDLSPNSTRDVSGSALSSHTYQDGLTTIGLDPDTTAGNSYARNPPFIEKHEIIYEFPYSFGFTNDRDEIAIYDTNETPPISTKFKRSTSRTDTLNLSLDEPNFLIEKTEGTVVDIYGNILDLNRQKLPSGSLDSLSFRKNQENKSQTFIDLREMTRKSIAYHWELNARKDLPQTLPNVNDSSDYARDRSRFFIDVDKEGQFKVNVPASSEKGNVPILARYENYSRVKAAEGEGEPTDFIRNKDDIDVFPDAFGAGSVYLTTAEGETKGTGGPTDRLLDTPIKLGTTFHDINGGLFLHKVLKPIIDYDDSILNRKAPVLERVVSEEIILGGDGANAGGRSGTISLDGSLSVSIGANTVDRQSLWLDCAGGIVANIGRDRKNISYAGTLDGDVFVQIGGSTVANDSRFEDLNNSNRDGTLDIRIMSSNQMQVIRIDSEGVSIFTPQRIDIVSVGEMRFKSMKGRMVFDAESIYFYGNDRNTGRLVNRKPGQTI